jgi:hypothetical protein
MSAYENSFFPAGEILNGLSAMDQLEPQEKVQ